MHIDAEKNGFTVRQLRSGDWFSFHRLHLAMRAEITPEDDAILGYDRARDTEEMWRFFFYSSKLIKFGLFEKAEIIGGAYIEYGSGRPLPLYSGDYILKSYRGLGLSSLLYEARAKFLRDHNHSSALIRIHKDNHVSRTVALRNGFVPLESFDRKEPDIDIFILRTVFAKPCASLDSTPGPL